MELCLVRHGIAVERDEHDGSDASRPLTPVGRSRMREAAAGLRTLFLPELILTSPLLRARQTAEIVAEMCEAPLQVLEVLGTGEHRKVLAECARLGEARVALVGHEPWLGRAALTAPDRFGRRHECAFQEGGGRSCGCGTTGATVRAVGVDVAAGGAASALSRLRAWPSAARARSARTDMSCRTHRPLRR